MSRKKQVYEKITALYCRISLDDGGDNESMSISNQKIMLRDFAEKHGMFQYEYYVDDGYTGRNFNRPAFQRMIADIEAGKIGCVITKDLSRLGRNYIEAGSYIEIFFPKHNVRYIAITDGVDSLTVPTDAAACANALAERLGAVVLLSGEEDLVTDGSTLHTVRGGSPLMRRVTGAGCMLSVLCGAFAAVEPDALTAARHAAAFWKCCATRRRSSPRTPQTSILYWTVRKNDGQGGRRLSARA